ncbi:iron uptake system protein EfeO [Nocardioides sp.]|uniref:iron uptake system protein EfeO n=1 Tax=Nocardioides sp. TaxID=35761 RepID=UPI002BE36844|nr:iron uptake system protein EfeO [Nocardioides sp.]HXH77769.1 iron uptake system protein EfeO [Nocardioides sp.]
MLITHRRTPPSHHLAPAPLTRTILLPVALTTALLLSGCAQDSDRDPTSHDAASPTAIAVESSEEACRLSAAEARAGTLTFSVENTGADVTEFYLLAPDGLRVVGEVENIGPGLTRDLTVVVPEGDYVTACKPGMAGEGIRADFTATRSSEDVTVTAGDARLVDQALVNYAAYVEDQTDQLVARTREFVDLYRSGDDDAARALYPVARTHWERIETVAESFGDLDPKIDAREADLAQGEKWTGWHLIEKDLWPQRAEDYTPLTARERGTYARDLMANTEELATRVPGLTYTVDQIANGSRGLLDEVATGKVTGEEEYWSRTDLYDFQANVDGARVAFEGVQPIVEQHDPELAEQIATRFEELQVLLDDTRQGDGFVSYDDLSATEVKRLSDAVNALSEPLSRLATAVV